MNGEEFQAPPYGFSSFFLDISQAVQPGENLIEVSCSNEKQPDCRWYSGGGIHRPVWLWIGSDASIEPEGIRVTTISIDPVLIRIEIDCAGGEPHIRILDESGAEVATGVGKDTVLTVPNPNLWSAEHPSLYRCKVELHDDGEVVDDAECSFGVRLI